MTDEPDAALVKRAAYGVSRDRVIMTHRGHPRWTIRQIAEHLKFHPCYVSATLLRNALKAQPSTVRSARLTYKEIRQDAAEDMRERCAEVACGISIPPHIQSHKAATAVAEEIIAKIAAAIKDLKVEP